METATERRVIDLQLLLGLVWARKLLFCAMVTPFVLLAVLYLHLTAPRYTVAMQVAPVGNDQGQAAGGLGGLAKLAGVDLNSNNPGAAQFRFFLSALTARDAANIVARDQDLLKVMFPRDWVASENRWQQHPSAIRPVAHAVERVLGFQVRPWHPPDGSDVQQYLSDNLEIYEDAKSPVVTLRIDSDDPQMARRLLTSLVGTVDQMLRQRALRRANDYVGYLSRELKVETVTEYRQTLMAHLAEQEQTLMMANAGVTFSMQVFNQPSIPSAPSAPKPVVLLLSAAILGSVLGVILCLLAARRGAGRSLAAASQQSTPID